MGHKEDLKDAGELTQWTYKRVLRHVRAGSSKHSAGNVPLMILVADDFQAATRHLRSNGGPFALSNEIGRIRGVFKFGYESGLIDKPVRFGPEFRKPSAKVLRQNRARLGCGCLSGRSLLALLDVAPAIPEGHRSSWESMAVSAMLTLATRLPIKAVNLKTGWLGI